MFLFKRILRSGLPFFSPYDETNFLLDQSIPSLGAPLRVHSKLCCLVVLLSIFFCLGYFDPIHTSCETKINDFRVDTTDVSAGTKTQMLFVFSEIFVCIQDNHVGVPNS